jgi:hypothetical protein
MTTVSNFEKLDVVKKYVATTSQFFSGTESRRRKDTRQKQEEADSSVAEKRKFINFYTNKVVT